MKKFFLYLFIMFSFNALAASEKQTVTPDVTLTNTYWKLVDIDTKVITRSEKLREPYFMLKEQNQLNGFTGCNRFFGSYTTQDNNINFSGVGMTRMMCQETMELERSFSKVIQEATHFKIQGEKLQLFNNTKLIASFRAVYF
ncbi:MAG: META domain-containing protein [Campylobacterota bacterium]|nr:META domain-containing protein [Campylobacterota bacterium]